jgi:hypothetical protein
MNTKNYDTEDTEAQSFAEVFRGRENMVSGQWNEENGWPRATPKFTNTFIHAVPQLPERFHRLASWQNDHAPLAAGAGKVQAEPHISLLSDKPPMQGRTL